MSRHSAPDEDGWVQVTKKPVKPKSQRLNANRTHPDDAGYDPTQVVLRRRLTKKDMPRTTQKRPDRPRDESQRLAKIDNQTESFQLQRVRRGLSRRIQQYRQANQLSQAQLAQMLNLPIATVADYESGKAIHVPKTTQTFNRFLNAKSHSEPAK